MRNRSERAKLESSVHCSGAGALWAAVGWAAVARGGGGSVVSGHGKLSSGREGSSADAGGGFRHVGVLEQYN